MTDHMLDDLTERDGWSVAICACGAESPPCPDDVTAANFWGQHALTAPAAPDQDPCPDCGDRGRLRPVPTSVITFRCPTCSTGKQPTGGAA